MVKKTLLVLANSIKNNARCVAGREIITQAGRRTLGNWIRPVSAHGEGELHPSEITCTDGSHLGVMDVAEVNLAGEAPDSFQPENWKIAQARCWRKLNTRPVAVNRSLLLEHPDDLWFDPLEERTDRVSHDRVKGKFDGHSLYVIRPDNLRLMFSTEFNRFKGRDKARRRALFTYNGVDYDFPLTDPMALDKYCPNVPSLDQPANVVDLAGKDGLLVCVSLAGDFQGTHYKILATVIEP